MSQLPIFLAFIILPFVPCSTSLTIHFSYSSFTDAQGINRTGAAFVNADGILELTSTARDSDIQNRAGWAMYANPITLYDAHTGFAADFQSNFSFQVSSLGQNCRGDGLAFFMAPANWTSSGNEANGYGLGIFNKSSSAENSQIIAVEFDTYKNDFDPSGYHMGIDIGSFVSNATVNWTESNKNSFSGIALIQYNSATGNLSSILWDGNDVLQGQIFRVVNLTIVLPQAVIVGFSASTGQCSEAHRISSWSFSATLPTPATAPSPTPNTAPNWPEGRKVKSTSFFIIRNKMVTILVFCLVPLLIIIIVVVIFVVVTRIKQRNQESSMGEINGSANVTRSLPMEEFANVITNFKNIGPREFSYEELKAATNGFSDEGKLGEGGFGGVYRGTLRDTNETVAVKRLFRSSSENMKGYVAEVTVIGRLSHRNLVKLIGSCHEQGEFLLVYEYMERGSLDSHIFPKKGQPVMSWAQRREVVLQLASAIRYLHEGWVQCVVHRDIKLNNVMVDREFNARLGDFGLARLSNHGFSLDTTTPMGTLGYAAPEYVTTGKASTQTDIYSFGVVLLEMATGQRAKCFAIADIEARLVQWVRDLHSYNSLMLAVDDRLGSAFDQREVERTMMVGLWCVHPDADGRPTIGEAINVLKFQAEMPKGRLKLPV